MVANPGQIRGAWYDAHAMRAYYSCRVVMAESNAMIGLTTFQQRKAYVSAMREAQVEGLVGLSTCKDWTPLSRTFASK